MIPLRFFSDGFIRSLSSYFLKLNPGKSEPDDSGFGYSTAFAFSGFFYPHLLRLALRLAFPFGRDTGLPRSAQVSERSGCRLYAGGPTSVMGRSGENPYLTAYLPVQAGQPLRLVTFNDVFMFTLPLNPRSRPHWGSQSSSPLTVWWPTFSDWGFFVPKASHLWVATYARPGRTLMAEHQVIAAYFTI